MKLAVSEVWSVQSFKNILFRSSIAHLFILRPSSSSSDYRYTCHSALVSNHPFYKSKFHRWKNCNTLSMDVSRSRHTRVRLTDLRAVRDDLIVPLLRTKLYWMKFLRRNIHNMNQAESALCPTYPFMEINYRWVRWKISMRKVN